MTTPWIITLATLWVVVLLVVVILLGLIRRVLPVLNDLGTGPPSAGGVVFGPGGLSPGSTLPTFEAQYSDGRLFSSSQMKGSPSIVLLAEPDCEPCQLLASELQRQDGIGVDLLFVSPEPWERDGAFPQGVSMLIQSGNSVSRAFRSAATPHAFAIDAAGTVVENTIPGSVEDLNQLAGRLTEEGGGTANAPGPPSDRTRAK
jgi:hypothetical protein